MHAAILTGLPKLIGISRRAPLPWITLVLLGATASAARPPDLANVPYGDHERQVLDLWKAAAPQPTPLVLFIHGGGWVAGDKAGVTHLDRYLAAGISVVSINYRFTTQAQRAGVDPPVKWPLEDAARALQFVRSKAAEWNLDKSRIGASGGSAGACSSLWLALHDDLADPTSGDAVARESTRLRCAAITGAQTTLDPQQMKEWTPNSRYGGHAFGFMADPADPKTRDLQFAEFLAARERLLPAIRRYSPIEHVSPDDPPIYMIYAAAPALGQEQKDPTHSANFGVKLQEKLRGAGVACELVHPGAVDVRHAQMADFLIDILAGGDRAGATPTGDTPEDFDDPSPQRYAFSARASEIDARVRAHPDFGFLLEKDGRPLDVQHAAVDTRVAPRGRLVLWLMGHSEPLFERLNSYGLHAIQPHYANGWFNRFGREAPPGDDTFLGRIRLEAATGEDFSDAVAIPKPDGIIERASHFVAWLAKENPPGRWEQFLTDDRLALRWERVILAGASHGATTSARMAKHVKVDRVVMLCGPRDQFETWQQLDSATPANRFFGFSHVLDSGWTGDHYCRSWELLGLSKFGPIVNVDQAAPPYGNSRRLVTDADVGNDTQRAHGAVTPGRSAVRDRSGNLLHEPVWRYLFTHPVEEVGDPVPADPGCRMDVRNPE